MPQNYRIYINDNSLFIGDYSTMEGLEFQLIDLQKFDFKTFYKKLKSNSHQNFLIPTSEPKKVLKRIKKQIILIKAAGGLVENSKNEYLFIFRNKKWDLPKGKVEKAEKNKKAAVREVEEECGIEIDKLGKLLCKTYHIYLLDNKIVLKKTYWYKMFVKSASKLKPQKEEGITAAEWVKVNKIPEKLTNTYPLIKEVLRSVDLL